MHNASANMFDLIAARARRPEQLAMETSDATSLTYGALLERSARAANALVALGVEPGARVAAQVAGGGVFQAIADVLRSALSWPVTREEARDWVSRLSKTTGPALVLAMDGLGGRQSDARERPAHRCADRQSPLGRAVR